MISYQLNFISLNGLIYYFFMEMSLLAWKQSSNSVVGYLIKEKLFIVVTITFFKKSQRANLLTFSHTDQPTLFCFYITI